MTNARRFPQFRLRTLIVGVVIACAAFASIRWFSERTRAQKKAIAAMAEVGGVCRYDFQVVNDEYDPTAKSWVPGALINFVGVDYFHPILSIEIVHRRSTKLEPKVRSEKFAQIESFTSLEVLVLDYPFPSADDLQHIARLSKLRRLHLGGPRLIAEDDVPLLSRLKNLKILTVSDLKTTDKTLEDLSELDQLRELSLPGGAITNNGLAHLKRLRHLETLSLAAQDGKITDDGIPHLTELAELGYLDLNGSNVTDKGIMQLQGMQTLRYLDVGYTLVRDVRPLQTALPKCKIRGPRKQSLDPPADR
jgi:hypothetical protein